MAVFSDLDAATAPRLHEELDSSGVAAGALRLKETGRTLDIRGAGERIRRTFVIAGLADHESLRFEPVGE